MFSRDVYIVYFKFPTAYTKNRRKALSYTLDLIKKDAAASSLFIFGDFNFRLDTKGVIKVRMFFVIFMILIV